MYVDRAIKFPPITITIETEAEATMIWHLLNQPTSSYALSSYAINHDYDKIMSKGRQARNWQKFNQVFQPQNSKPELDQ